jgi:hypothetical protein
MVQLWECLSGGNNFCGYIFANDEDLLSGIFNTNGLPKQWVARPGIKSYVAKKAKDNRLHGDFDWLLPGAIILNEKAFVAAKEFLLQFGELRTVECNSDFVYFYNVTNIVSCIDFDRSEKSSTGKSILKAEFRQEAIPQDTQIFKDPLTAGSRIYLTQAAKDALEKLIAENGLTGLRFFEAGKKF